MSIFIVSFVHLLTFEVFQPIIFHLFITSTLKIGWMENAECGVRSVENGSVENGEYGKLGGWKMRSVENTEYGK